MPKVSVVKPIKPLKALKNAHTPNTKHGMGTFTGGSVKNPMGRMIEGMGAKAATKKQVGKAPKSLA